MTNKGARDDERDAVAVAIAKAADADYWTDEIREWEESEEWEREAHPDNYPHTAYEDRDWYRKQADAAIAALARKRPQPEITEEVVAAAYKAFVAGPVDARESMRAALEAVLRVLVGEGEQR